MHTHTHTHVIGSRSALVNMEVRGEVAPILNRKCVVIRWSALSSEKFLDIIHRGAGAIVVLLPQERGGVDEVEGGGEYVYICMHMYVCKMCIHEGMSTNLLIVVTIMG